MTVTPMPGKPNLILGSFDIADLGYDVAEYSLSGTASSHGPVPETADYTTRMVILTPTDPDRFNGTVLVEWLNVSGGIDAPALWFMAHREIVRSGYGYVAVSVQRVGVEGGESLGGIPGMSLKALDPARYASLHHPGDTFAYSIFSQAGAAIREKLGPEHVVAVGESQSALFLTTYVNAVDALDRVYDGFLVHSRFGPAAPLDGGSIFEAAATGEAVTFRDDLRVPLMTVITETDLCGGLRLGYHRARQPDTEQLRTWEVPGTAHADNYTIQVGRIDNGFAPLDDILAAYAPTDVLMGQQLPNAINFAPQHHYVLQAALDKLANWVRTGAPAPSAPRIELTDAEPVMPILDANGLARGGVRTPWVDVPVARTSGIGFGESPLVQLFGSGELFDGDTLRRLYPGGVSDYLERFTPALDAAIGAGFILPADRAEILELVAAGYPRPALQN
jgi:Alpha/beta hydrolase domain